MFWLIGVLVSIFSRDQKCEIMSEKAFILLYLFFWIFTQFSPQFSRLQFHPLVRTPPITRCYQR